MVSTIPPLDPRIVYRPYGNVKTNIIEKNAANRLLCQIIKFSPGNIFFLAFFQFNHKIIHYCILQLICYIFVVGLWPTLSFGAVAQLVRASDCRSEGCEFESRRPRL